MDRAEKIESRVWMERRAEEEEREGGGVGRMVG